MAADQPAPKGIQVTATDLESGETRTVEIMDDYVIITAGTCHVAHLQTYPTSGTDVLTVKGRKGREA